MLRRSSYSGRRKKPLAKRLLIVLGLLAALGAAVFFAVQFYIVRSAKEYIVRGIADMPECDAALVPGARVYDDGNPSPVLRDRLDYALLLYERGKAGKILVSGDHGREEYDEVNAMKEYLIGKGVPGEDIFMDHAGFNTYDSIIRAKEVFLAGSVIISTQEFHISRAVYIARKLGLEAYGYPCGDKPAYNMTRLRLRESFARVKAFWDVLVKRGPKYSGDPIPIGGDGNLTGG